MNLASMEWVRGASVGHGSFAAIDLAIPRSSSARFPSLMVAKSSEACCSTSLQNEKEVLDQLGVCPQIIRCFGDDYSIENGEKFYNLFLEYASGGSLADQLKSCGGRLPESDIRRYTRTILKGLSYIHAKGFVHCDIKLHNVLMFDNGDVKIADFGLAKKTGIDKQSMEEGRKLEWRGTPLYMSPESVNENEYESPVDIWALACAVVEMVTGKPAWKCRPGAMVNALLIRIGVGDELPEVPQELSEEGKDFLGKCFLKDPRKRWTAEMLLNHPFVAAADDEDSTVPLKDTDELSTSPRCPFDFSQWFSLHSSVGNSVPSFPSPESKLWFGGKENSCFDSSSSCGSLPGDRLRQLMTDQRPNWTASDSWVAVR